MIPEGQYTATCIDKQFGTTSTGKKQVVLRFRIDSGEHAGQELNWYGYFTDRTWERTLESLRYCGFKGDNLDQLGPLDQQVSIVVGHNEYEGKTSARVDWINRLGEGSISLSNPMKGDELRKFAASMRKRVQGVPEVDGPKGDVDAFARRDEEDDIGF